MACNFIKTGLQNRCFPVKFAKFFRTTLVAVEAVARRYSVKKVFLEISQNSQENTCARVSFLIKLIKLQLSAVAASVNSFSENC